ncbi:response regulator transcription factor [Isoptericola sp. NPDC019482]|uniref:response regulator transcription factor n=1 Tax=Isoptericola sp. NPDC019482 TaxID=3154688 RepID=UPI003484673E
MIRVLLADDHELLRTGIASVLSSDPDLAVVGQCADGPTAVRECARLRPDVVLMDVEMPGGDGISATAALLAADPTTRVVVLTMFDLDEYVVGALRAGASGFLIKTTPPRELVAAVKACAAGDATFGPSVMDRLVRTYVGSAHVPHPGLDELTARERDVLRALAGGRSNAEIASHLFLAETTVKTHVARILTKLGVRDRVQAVVVAHEGGLVGPT